ALGRCLIETAVKHALRNQARQPVGEYVGGDAQFRLDLVIPAIGKKSLSYNHEAPFVADDLQCARHRTWPPQHEPAAVGRAPCVPPGLCSFAAGARAVSVLNRPWFEFGRTCGTGHDGVTLEA